MNYETTTAITLLMRVVLDVAQDNSVVGAEINNISKLQEGDQSTVVYRTELLKQPLNWKPLKRPNNMLRRLMSLLSKPKVTYDEQADSVYFRNSNKPITRQRIETRKVVIDVDRKNNVVGIEIPSIKK